MAMVSLERSGVDLFGNGKEALLGWSKRRMAGGRRKKPELLLRICVWQSSQS